MKIFLIFVLIICLVSGCETSRCDISVPSDEIIVVLYPSETTIDKHRFIVNKDGKLLIEIDNIPNTSFEEMYLSEEQVNVLYVLANEIRSQEYISEPPADDAMYITMEYNGFSLKQEFSKMSPSVRQLVSELVRIYPARFGNYVLTSELSLRKEQPREQADVSLSVQIEQLVPRP